MELDKEKRSNSSLKVLWLLYLLIYRQIPKGKVESCSNQLRELQDQFSSATDERNSLQQELNKVLVWL